MKVILAIGSTLFIFQRLVESIDGWLTIAPLYWRSVTQAEMKVDKQNVAIEPAEFNGLPLKAFLYDCPLPSSIREVFHLESRLINREMFSHLNHQLSMKLRLGSHMDGQKRSIMSTLGSRANERAYRSAKHRRGQLQPFRQVKTFIQGRVFSTHQEPPSKYTLFFTVRISYSITTCKKRYNYVLSLQFFSVINNLQYHALIFYRYLYQNLSIHIF